MESWQLLDSVVGRGEPKTLADRLHVSRTTINNWCIAPPSDGGEGQYSPIERVAQMVEILREIGNDKSEELVQWLLERLGYLPGVRVDALGKATFAYLGDAMQKFGETIVTVTEATKDQVVTDEELEAVVAKGEAAHRSFYVWLTDMKALQTSRNVAKAAGTEPGAMKNFVSMKR